MASVYKAYEAALDRYVAVKVLPAEFLHDPTFAERFRREAKVVARLEHPNIIPIFSFDIEQGTPWMAMRMIGGGSLSGILKQGPLPRERIVAILAGVASALDYAHSKGVIHRDVKPQNVLLDEDGRVYLADFGIARMVESSSGLTQTGMISGTPQYMAPEQATAQTVDHRADIYALGIMAYEMFTGHVPFSADTPVAVLMKHVQEPMPLPPPGSVPEPAIRAILKCAAKKADDRWASGTDFVHALQEGLGVLPTVVSAAAVRVATPAVGTTAVGATYLVPRPATGASAPAPTVLGTSRSVPPAGGRSATMAVAIVGGVGALALLGGILALWLWARSKPEIPVAGQALGGETPPPLTMPPTLAPPSPGPLTPEPTPSTSPFGPSTTTPPAVTPRTPPPATRPVAPFVTPPTPVPPTTLPTPESVPPTTVPTPRPEKKLGHPFKLGSPIAVSSVASGPTTLKNLVFKHANEELLVEAEAKVEKGEDQKVTVNVTLLDGDGTMVAKGQGIGGIEENETGKVKFRLKLGQTVAAAVRGFEVSLTSVPD